MLILTFQFVISGQPSTQPVQSYDDDDDDDEPAEDMEAFEESGMLEAEDTVSCCIFVFIVPRGCI